LESKDATIFNEPVYLVCTHGKVDVCCSKFGIPIYKAMTELNKNTWQATHVTGDRFAPNVVQLPYAHYYGWVDINELDDFCTTLMNGNIFMKKYRGRACHTKGEQAAEFFLRNELNDSCSNAVTFLSTTVLNHTQRITRYQQQADRCVYEVHYTTEQSAEKYFMNCKAEEAVTVEHFKLARIIKHE
jgi:hypothetical protein